MANLKLASAPAEASVVALAALANGGKIAIYTGTQPTDPTVAITGQTKLVEFTLGSPAFGAAASDAIRSTVTLNNPTPVAALATGTAAWFRVSDSGGVALWDGDVTDTTGNGNVKMSTTSIVSGINVAIVLMTYSQRKN